MHTTRERKANRVKMTEDVGKMIDEAYEELKETAREGRKVAWVVGVPNLLLLRAMDVPFIYGESHSAGAAARKETDELLEVARGAGFLDECCSYSRINYGLALIAKYGYDKPLKPDQSMPKPDFVICTNGGCSTETQWFMALCRLFDVPGFLIDVPWVDINSEQEVRYKINVVVEQLRDLACFLEKMCRRPFDWKKLSEAMSILKKASELRGESLRLCRHIPSPASLFDLSISLGPVNALAGRPGTPDYFERLNAELRRRIDDGIGAVKNEQYRLYFDGIMMWPKIGSLTEKFASLNACLLAARYTHLGFYHMPERLDPNQPLESIADFLIRMQLNRNPVWLTEQIGKLCRENHIDGMVIHNMRTCRPFDVPQHRLAEGIQRELGIPSTIIEADHADVNFYSESQLDTRLQALIETIDARRQR